MTTYIFELNAYSLGYILDLLKAKEVEGSPYAKDIRKDLNDQILQQVDKAK